MKTTRLFHSSYFLLLFAFQGCISNDISSLKSPKAAPVTVETHDGYTYILPWYEVHDGKLISILNTSRVVLQEEQIIEVAIERPQSKKVSLSEALLHDGEISIIAFDDGKFVHHYKFYELKKARGNVVGYMNTGDYAANIIIPLDNVKKIDVGEIENMDDTAKKIFRWSVYGGLQCLLIYHGYPDMIWLY